MLVDSHCHLDKLKLDELGLDLTEAQALNKAEALDAVLNKARAKGVEKFLCVSVTLDDFPNMVETVSAHPDVVVSCGVHPLHHECEYKIDDLIKMASNPNVVAIGETGLDYFYSAETIEWQQNSFRQHCQVSRQLNKPLIIHTRDARKDTIDILKQEGADHAGGVLHCFTESLAMAKAAIDLNFYISISGIVTFGNANELRDVVRALPLDRILVETDSPWLAPKPHRGKQNQPAYVHDVAQFVADLKGVSLDTLAQATTQNFYQLFKGAV